MRSTASKRFGATQLRVPSVGQGTWGMERDPVRAVEALRHGVDLGLSHIDTAEIYADGAVEKLVGRALAGIRERVQLVSKVNPSHASCQGLVAACEASLRRLDTDHLDVYLLHWLSPFPISETVAGFEKLVETGKIRYWGVSNLDEVKLAEFVAVSGRGRIACNQVMHHLGERRIEHDVAPWCQRERIAVVGYSPFGAGAFPPRSAAGAQTLADAAAELGATPRQVALAFLIRKSAGFTIPKASRREHVEENAGALSLDLPKEIVARLDLAFPKGERRAGVPLW